MILEQKKKLLPPKDLKENFKNCQLYLMIKDNEMHFEPTGNKRQAYKRCHGKLMSPCYLTLIHAVHN